MKLRAGTGASRAEKASDAGREAAAMALAALGSQTAELLVVFTSPRYDLTELLAAIRDLAGGVRLIGATGSGEMVLGQYMGFGAGVAVLAIGGGRYRFGIASASHIGGDLDQAGQDIARRSRAEAGPSPHAAVLLLADALLGDLQELFRGVYRVTGPKVSIVGGAAADEQKFIATFVFHDGKVIEQGAVALWIASEFPLQVVTRHGWRPIGLPQWVTRVEGASLVELGGRPAAAVYEELLGLAPGDLSPDAFWGTSILHPFGLPQPDGSTIIRVARSKTAEGSLCVQGCVPPDGSAVHVMSGNADSLMAVVEEVATTALAGVADPGLLLAFSCAARATIFQARAAEEPRRLQDAAGEVPTFGIYCCGEFARTSGVLGTHNATLTAIAL